jgi:NADPH:quinone reductase
MRTLILRGSSGPDSIAVVDRDTPAPGPGAVLIRVHAATVNPADPFLWRKTPDGSEKVPGLEAAGVVAAVGEGVGRLHVGDRVMAVVNPHLPGGGAQAAAVVVPEASVVRIGDELAFDVAATLPMTGLTALEGLRLLDLNEGALPAVTGGAGVVASYLIPIAKQRGLIVVADAAPEDRARVSAAGADHVVARGDAFAQEVRALFPDGVDAVLDTAAVTVAAVPALKDAGSIAVVRGWTADDAPERGVQVRAVSVGAAMGNTDELELLADLAAGHVLDPIVLDVVGPEDARAAYERVEAGGVRGRIVITFAEERPLEGRVVNLGLPVSSD